MSRLLDDLNEPQRQAVTTTEGPLLVIAGAGSGKTRVLTRRVAYILRGRKAEPYQVLAVTFTNKAAGEMKARVNDLLGGQPFDLNVSTFHSFCARLLRREAAAIGYDQHFTIFDQEDSRTLAKNCVKELGFAENQFHPRAQLRKISDAKNNLQSAEQFAAAAQGYFETRTAQIYTLYQRRLREYNAMDFDDLLFNAVTLLKDTPTIGEKYRRRFRYLLVDEYQDTNHAQYLLLKYLLGEHQNLCVVGDEDQSIYGWRGADIRNILEFEKDFPGATIIKLEENFRSTEIILKAASAVIGNNQARKGKTLWTSRPGGDQLDVWLVNSAEDEALEVIHEIERTRSQVPLNEMVILYRTNAQSRAFEEQLRRAGIAYQIVGGVSFYQRKEIKDLLAYLKLIVNPKDDISFLRIINYPKRGIGQKTIADLTALAREDGVSLYEVVQRASGYPQLGSKAKRMQPFAELIESLRARAETATADLLIQDLVEEVNFLAELRAEDEITAQTRVENIEAFVEGAAEYTRTRTDATLADYLAEISLFTDLDSYAEVDDKVTLMTLHSAKGLEFDHVFMVGLEEGLFPLQRTITEPMELEEERRLFYVGATRACKKLYLLSAMTRHRFGEVESMPSRFLREVPEELVTTRDLRTRRVYERDRVPPATASPQVDGFHYEYEENEMMREGRIILHPTFGRGRIVKTEGFGDSLRLEIMFTGVGLKKIMARFARLKVIG